MACVPNHKFPDKSALEVIMSMRHSGGKFAGKADATSGGLHGVVVSVVNALSAETVVEVARNRELYRQSFSRVVTLGPLAKLGPPPNRRRPSVTFFPHFPIFRPTLPFNHSRLFRLPPPHSSLFSLHPTLLFSFPSF